MKAFGPRGWPKALDVGAIGRSASETVTGILRLATQGLVDAGTDDLTAATPLKLAKTPRLMRGDCRLVKSGANLLLDRFNGQHLWINGRNEIIPASLTLGVGGLAASTLYYIYAFMNAGVMTLEASIAARATDATYFHQIKSGDGTRSLVGLARTNGGTAWADTAAQRFVRSWFNGAGVGGMGAVVGPATTSSSVVELTTTARAEFLAWANEHFYMQCTGTVTSNTVDSSTNTRVLLDGTSQGTITTLTEPGANYGFPVAPSYTAPLSEGYHYITPGADISGGGTSTWFNLAAHYLSVRQ